MSAFIATNGVNMANTITATVSQDDGLPAGAPGDAVTGFGPFFFSSRGRHTIFSRDWSSDVCSSDLHTCTTTGGTCSVQINSTAAGSVDIHATTTFSVG